MSRKNHEWVNGRLLQTDKSFSALKERQKTKIHEWFKEETLRFYQENHRMPMKKYASVVVDAVYRRIEDAEIWIPYGEVYRAYQKKKTRIINGILKAELENNQEQISD